MSIMCNVENRKPGNKETGKHINNEMNPAYYG
jgi:hypothetical protein